MRYVLSVIFACVPLLVVAQEEHKSIHQLESEAHAQSATTDLPAASTVYPRPLVKRAGGLLKKVFGWQPYWNASLYANLDYGALTHVAYFSYETDTATGGYKTIRGWDTTPIIAYAHARGVKVVLTVTNFGSASNTTLLSDTNKQNTMINTLVYLLLQRNGDGVNFDFEIVPASQKTNLVKFIQKASSLIKASIFWAEISMATPAVDWSKSWDLPALGQACDYLIIMGYDYYYSGSTTAGPVAPLSGETYNATNSVDTYLAAGVPKEKLLLGAPWYGYDWPVSSNVRKASATGTGTAQTYSAITGMAGLSNRIFDATTQVPYFSYQSGTQWRQLWYDDVQSLSLKNGLVNARDIGGIGIWALGYQGSGPELWNSIKSSFTTSVAAESNQKPVSFTLRQNYPNPFNPSTTIEYELAQPGRVFLCIIDPLGREVATLEDGFKGAGRHQNRWNAKGQSSGIYFCRLLADGLSVIRPMVFLK